MTSPGSAVSKYDPKLVVKLVALTWLITKLICYKLWLTDRLFPLIPVHSSLADLPASVHITLFIISLGSLLLLLLFPNRKLVVLLLAAELLSCMLDQDRWQPWEYQFMFMMAAFAFIKDEKETRFSWQLILAGIYFFSGVSKFNSAFIHDVWQNLILHRWLGIYHTNVLILRTGYALPLIEMAAGIFLLINRTRRLAIPALVLMHLLILVMLGPAGLNMNAVVWPWNVLMPVLLYVLFFREAFQYSYFFSLKLFAWIVFVCWWILPWFQQAGYWDKYLSSVLYSGGVDQLYICTGNELAKKEMAEYMDKEFKVIPCSPVLSVYKWGNKEMHTVPYPEKRVYNAIMKAWKKKYPGSNDRFYIYRSGFAYSVKEVFPAP